jgi:cytochrome c-type biogenesis protein CcmE
VILNTKRRRVAAAIAVLLLGSAAATAFVLTAFSKNLMYFYTPSQVAGGEAPGNRPFRIGGLVVAGSVERDPSSLAVNFRLTDTLHEVPVHFDGVLPDLFREGQGIVANGRLETDGTFSAAEVLAKHDENYMPPEVAEALKRAGVHLPEKSYQPQP